MVFLPLASQTKGLVAGWLEIRTLSGLPKHTISLLNSLSNRAIWEPWPPDSDLTGLAGLASRCRLAGNPDSGQSPEAYDVLLNSLANRSIWEPWPPDPDLAGLMGWPLAARQLAGNPDSGLPTAAQGKRGGRRFCCLGGGMREGVLFMSSNVLLLPIQ